MNSCWGVLELLLLVTRVVIRVFWMVAQAVTMVFLAVVRVFLVIARVPRVTSWVSPGTIGYHLSTT